MVKALTASQARAQLGRLLDRAVTGKPFYLSHAGRLLRIAPVAARPKAKGTASRPFGCFTFDDDLSALANRATLSFTPLDEN